MRDRNDNKDRLEKIHSMKQTATGTAPGPAAATAIHPAAGALFILLIAAMFTVSSCRKDAKVTPEETTAINDPGMAGKSSFYLLNEGNMDMNKASLDFFDHGKGIYRHNIFSYENPDVTLGLGDVGNDLGIYGSKLYAVINNSNKVEVLDARNGKRIGMISIVNCRHITFHEGKAYISSYQSGIGGSSSANGYVARVDTSTLLIEKTVTVGRQPEEMAIVAGKLYVANSGGYNSGQYENTLSVIDLATFSEIKRIEVAINLDHVKADQYGDLYVTSRGDSYSIPSRLFVVDTGTGQVKKTFDLAASNLCISGDMAYVIATEYSYPLQKNTISYAVINVKDETIVSNSFITDGTDQSITKPYGIAVDPQNKDIYLTDARDFVTPGTLYCFDKNGRKKWSVYAGDVPAHFAFVNN